MRSNQKLLAQRSYQPDVLLDIIRQKISQKNDRQMSISLGISPATISRIRHRKIGIGDGVLLVFHEATGLSIEELRQIMGDKQPIKRRLKVIKNFQ